MEQEQAGQKRIRLQVNSVAFDLDDARVVIESDLLGSLNITIHPRPIGKYIPIHIETRKLSGFLDAAVKANKWE
jgi:hypothetical protein